VALIENKSDKSFFRLEMLVDCKSSSIIFNLTFQKFAFPCSAGTNEKEFPAVI
jgi:hypothetical protein